MCHAQAQIIRRTEGDAGVKHDGLLHAAFRRNLQEDGKGWEGKGEGRGEGRVVQ